jgi:cobalamin synthase
MKGWARAAAVLMRWFTSFTRNLRRKSMHCADVCLHHGNTTTTRCQLTHNIQYRTVRYGTVPELLLWVDGLLLEDGVVDVLDVFAVEGRRPRQQHVAQHAQRPDVAAVVVRRVQHFRSYIHTT